MGHIKFARSALILFVCRGTLTGAARLNFDADSDGMSLPNAYQKTALSSRIWDREELTYKKPIRRGGNIVRDTSVG